MNGSRLFFFASRSSQLETVCWSVCSRTGDWALTGVTAAVHSCRTLKTQISAPNFQENSEFTDRRFLHFRRRNRMGNKHTKQEGTAGQPTRVPGVIPQDETVRVSSGLRKDSFNYHVHLLTDKPIYKPGDTVFQTRTI